MKNINKKRKQEGIKEVEKVKITKKELDEIYELIPDLEDKKNIPEEEIDNKNFSFEQYTEYYDKQKVEEDAT